MIAAILALREERAVLRDNYRSIQLGAEPSLGLSARLELMSTVRRAMKEIDEALDLITGRSTLVPIDNIDVRDFIEAQEPYLVPLNPTRDVSPAANGAILAR